MTVVSLSWLDPDWYGGCDLVSLPVYVEHCLAWVRWAIDEEWFNEWTKKPPAMGRKEYVFSLGLREGQKIANQVPVQIGQESI